MIPYAIAGRRKNNNSADLSALATSPGKKKKKKSAHYTPAGERITSTSAPPLKK